MITTPTQSLSERLRERFEYDDLPLLREAGDALDAKDELIKRQSAEIGRLVAVTLHCGAQEAEVERLHERVAELQAQWGYTESIQAAEIELLKEGRKLHDEHADHLEHELAAQSALLAQAAAALDEIIQWWGEDRNRECEPHFISGPREALAAIRAKGVP